MVSHLIRRAPLAETLPPLSELRVTRAADLSPRLTPWATLCRPSGPEILGVRIRDKAGSTRGDIAAFRPSAQR